MGTDFNFKDLGELFKVLLLCLSDNLFGKK